MSHDALALKPEELHVSLRTNFVSSSSAPTLFLVYNATRRKEPRMDRNHLGLVWHLANYTPILWMWFWLLSCASTKHLAWTLLHDLSTSCRPAAVTRDYSTTAITSTLTITAFTGTSTTAITTTTTALTLTTSTSITTHDCCYYSLLMIHYSFLIINYPLLTTNYSLRTTHSPLPTS